MIRSLYWRIVFVVLLSSSVFAVPVIDPISNASVPAGKSLIIPVTASSPNGRPLTYTASSSTNRIVVELQTNNAFWKMSVVQAAPSNAPGAFETPFRGGVVVVTNVGDMTFLLFKDIAPRTVDVFQGLTASGFYNSNTIFHRVVPGFVIQGGDPQTNGSGGAVFHYDDEFQPRALFSGNGQLALANSGKDTDGSQFFVTLGPQRFLDLGYTLFGQLLRGFNVLTNIGTTATNGASRPLADVIITKASFVPDTTDTALIVTGTNLAGVAGTITVIADDGVGGRATNTFVATTAADPNNEPPILKLPAITNLFIPVNGRVTNFISAVDMEGNTLSYDTYYVNFNAQFNSTISNFNGSTGQFTVVPNPGYSGPLRFYVAVSQSTNFSPYDYQQYTFAVGDTPIVAAGTNFIATAQSAFTDQLVATFTNGIPNSATNSFAANINWGDNVVTAGVISSNLSGRKEVRGSHSYTNSGTYPIYVTIFSAFGTDATVRTVAEVPPSLSLVRSNTNNVLRWPAWATAYQLQSQTNLTATIWNSVTNLSSLVGYESVVTNATMASNLFFRLKN